MSRRVHTRAGVESLKADTKGVAATIKTSDGKTSEQRFSHAIVAVGIAFMLLGIGLAFFLGKPFIQPSAPRLPSISLGFFSDIPQVQSALRVNVLFLIGLVLAPALFWFLENTRFGLALRTVGESAETARAMGYDVKRVRLVATAAGGVLAGIGGSFLSLFYPGSWNEGLSSGQGLMAVALVIFALEGLVDLDEANARYFTEGRFVTREASTALSRNNSAQAERNAQAFAKNPEILALARTAAKDAIRQNLAIPLQVAGYENARVEVRFEGETAPAPR